MTIRYQIVPRFNSLSRANSMVPEDECEDESPFCECGNEPMLEERDCNQCMSCGKPLE